MHSVPLRPTTTATPTEWAHTEKTLSLHAARPAIAWRRRARPTRRERTASAVLGLGLLVFAAGLFAAVCMAPASQASRSLSAFR